MRLDDDEQRQLLRVADRHCIGVAGVLRAGVDVLDQLGRGGGAGVSAPAPRVVATRADVDLALLAAAVNKVGVNANQVAKQGWRKVQPEADALRAVTEELRRVLDEVLG